MSGGKVLRTVLAFTIASVVGGCARDTVDESSDAAAILAAADAAPPATAAECAQPAAGELFTRPGTGGEPTVTIPALAGWSEADSDGLDELGEYAVTDGRSSVGISMTSEPAASTTVGAELDLAKSIVENLPGWQRVDYRAGITACGFPAIAESGTVDLVLGTHVFGTFVAVERDGALYVVRLWGQMTGRADEGFLRDYPIMVRGLRIR